MRAGRDTDEGRSSVCIGRFKCGQMFGLGQKQTFESASERASLMFAFPRMCCKTRSAELQRR